ncbi:hypothetical protein C8J57DRAFT_1470070 [Mycena rebaudengoi]|nr:hypothetical protein C8J57DRAFT_1470070 [Mycena rebaudengoi]
MGYERGGGGGDRRIHLMPQTNSEDERTVASKPTDVTHKSEINKETAHPSNVRLDLCLLAEEGKTCGRLAWSKVRTMQDRHAAGQAQLECGTTRSRTRNAPIAAPPPKKKTGKKRWVAVLCARTPKKKKKKAQSPRKKQRNVHPKGLIIVNNNKKREETPTPLARPPSSRHHGLRRGRETACRTAGPATAFCAGHQKKRAVSGHPPKKRCSPPKKTPQKKMGRTSYTHRVNATSRTLPPPQSSNLTLQENPNTTLDRRHHLASPHPRAHNFAPCVRESLVHPTVPPYRLDTRNHLYNLPQREPPPGMYARASSKSACSCARRIRSALARERDPRAEERGVQCVGGGGGGDSTGWRGVRFLITRGEQPSYARGNGEGVGVDEEEFLETI